MPPTAFKAGRANSTSVRENEKAAENPNAAAHRYCKRKSREPLGHEVLIDASGAPDPRPAPGRAAKWGRNSIELVKKQRHSGSDDDDDDDDDGDSSSGKEDSEHSSKEDANCTNNGRIKDDSDDDEEMDADDDNGEEDEEELLQSGATKLARRKDSAQRKDGAIKIQA